MPQPQVSAQANLSTSPRSGANYYKDVMAANKDIKNGIKEIKVHKIELVMNACKAAKDKL